MFVDREAAFPVERQTVRSRLPVRRNVDARVAALRPEDRQSVVVRPAINRVAVRIAEQEVSIGNPHGTLGEEKPFRELLDRGGWRHDSVEPGIEALAHVSTFAPTGRSKEWSQSVAVGTTAAFEIRNIDVEKKRIGVALVQTAREAEEAKDVREYTERADAAPQEHFGSLIR